MFNDYNLIKNEIGNIQKLYHLVIFIQFPYLKSLFQKYGFKSMTALI